MDIYGATKGHFRITICLHNDKVILAALVTVIATAPLPLPFCSILLNPV